MQEIFSGGLVRLMDEILIVLICHYRLTQERRLAIRALVLSIWSMHSCISLIHK